MKKFYSYFLSFFCLQLAPVYSQISPISSVAKVGQSVTFNVTVDGTSPFTYQWRKDGVNISGATTNPFVLSNVTTSTAGNYTVVVANAFGNATSNTATLKILAAPVFTTQPAGINIIIGNTLTLSAVATGNPSPTYQWFKDGVAITGATSATYSLANATTANSGTYYVIATSTLDGVSSSTTSNNAVVAVTGKAPTIINISIQINE